MSKLLQTISKSGRQLVAHGSQTDGEVVRYRSSYAFFHRVIRADQDRGPAGTVNEATSVVDIGFATGFGCALLSSLPGAKIVGVDIIPECETYGRQYYERRNVEYLIEDLTTYIPTMPTFDYAVSRGVLQHVPNGLKLIGQVKFVKRALIDVPFDEKPGDHDHLVVGIREKAFADLRDCEFFYEDFEGNIYDAARKPERPNLIMVVMSVPGLPKVSEMFDFPIAAVCDDDLERASVGLIGGKRYDLSRAQLLDEAARAIRETDIVADIGCGIMPMNYFRPKLHLLIEPWKEYSDIISYRYRDDKSVLVLRCGALEALLALADRSIDSIFMLDVIEHLEKEEGHQVLVECERVVREQIIVFTPLGFMPQHMEAGEKDGWGLSGASVQEHRSGWTPKDFGNEWSFYVSEDFHQVNFKHGSLGECHGAFFAIRSFDLTDAVSESEVLNDLRRPLPSELEAARLHAENVDLSEKLAALHADHASLVSKSEISKSAYSSLLKSLSMRFYLGILRRLKSLTSA